MRSKVRYFAIVMFVVWAAFYAAGRAIDLPTFHLDGAFQTASGLYRLDAGQLPGRDFYPYLGVAPLLALFPIFKVAGADLAASVFSAQLMTLLATWLAVSVLSHLVFRPASFWTSLAWGAAFVAVPTAASETFGSLPRLLRFGLSPGNSLRPIRSVLPYLLAAIWYFQMRNPMPAARLAALAGALTGITLTWSNDFALPTAAMFVPLVLVTLARQGHLNFRSLLILTLTTVGCWLTLLLIFTGGHPLSLLRYNFLDVAPAQWWYFAPYTEDSRIFSPVDLWRLLREEDGYPFLMLAAATWCAYRSKRMEHAMLAWIGATLFLGGALASVGGHLDGYFRAMSYWARVLTLLWIIRLIVRASVGWSMRHRLASQLLLPMRKARASTVTVGLSLALSAAQGGLQFASHLDAARKDSGRFYVSELGGYLGAQWTDYVERARQTTAVIAEEYWGVWSALRREVPPSPVDSLIHALGTTRDTVEASLARADVVTTTRYAVSDEWQPWSISQNYWFYDHLIAGWEPSELAPTVVVWQRQTVPRQLPSIPCDTSGSGQHFSLPSAAPGFYRLRLAYQLPTGGRFLLMARNNISRVGGGAGYVSLDLTRSSSSFPLRVRAGEATTYDVRVVGIAAPGFRILSCEAARIPFDNPEILHTP